MGEHFTKNTLETTAFCKQCQRRTQHRVDGGRLGPCIDLNHKTQHETKKQTRDRKKREDSQRNPELPFQ